MGLTMGQRRALAKEMAHRVPACRRHDRNGDPRRVVDLYGCTRHHAAMVPAPLLLDAGIHLPEPRPDRQVPIAEVRGRRSSAAGHLAAVPSSLVESRYAAKCNEHPALAPGAESWQGTSRATACSTSKAPARRPTATGPIGSPPRRRWRPSHRRSVCLQRHVGGVRSREQPAQRARRGLTFPSERLGAYRTSTTCRRSISG